MCTRGSSTDSAVIRALAGVCLLLLQFPDANAPGEGGGKWNCREPCREWPFRVGAQEGVQAGEEHAEMPDNHSQSARGLCAGFSDGAGKGEADGAKK